jgi:hypothetical protein
MYYSRPTFFIKKNSTLPKLKFELSEDLMRRYDITDAMLENCAVTFSMQDADNSGIYKIANQGGDLAINEDFVANPDDCKYNLTYKFSLKDTSKPGIFSGSFMIDFLGEGNCGKIGFPVTDTITIVVQDNIVKTTVI